MSTNSSKPNKTEEVDLRALFKLIGNTFDRFSNFFINIFKSIFLSFVWLIFLIKKHIIVLSSALVLGYLIGFFITKLSPPKFESSVAIVQNYPTGKNLYGLAKYYNNLIKQKDYETLAQALEVDTEKTTVILGFEVKPLFNGNDNIVAFNEFLLEIDTLASPPVQYKEFLANTEDHSYKYQQISIQSTVQSSFKPVFSKIVKSINLTPYFISEQNKDIVELTKTKEALEFSLIKSDSLKSTYQRVLEQELINNNPTEIGITFESSSQMKRTKEYELYNSDIELKRELVEIERALLDKQYIIEVVSNSQDSGLTDDAKEIFGVKLPLSLLLALVLFLFIFASLLVSELLRFTERFRSKIGQ